MVAVESTTGTFSTTYKKPVADMIRAAIKSVAESIFKVHKETENRLTVRIDELAAALKKAASSPSTTPTTFAAVISVV